MRDLLRGRLANKYIFFEMLPTFLLGVFTFIFIILMFQSFRLTEYVIVHGANTTTILKILFYLAISFLPVILPMSLLFTVLLTYGRLSADSEIVAFKALGLNIIHLTLPAIVLASAVTLASAQTSYFLAPWGNRNMEVLVHKLGETKPGVTIKEGVFSEGFFDMVVYANKVDSKNDIMKKVFIYDERDANSPFTIIANQGKMINETTALGQKAYLRLFDGNIHRNNDNVYTKVDFDTFDINLFDPANYTEKKKTPLSYTLTDLNKAFANSKDYSKKFFAKLKIEYHRRTALALACLIFGLLGVGLGTTTNSRGGRSSGFVLCISVVVLYWLLYAGAENLAKNGRLPVWLAVWSVNIGFLAFAIHKIRQART